MNKVSGAKIPNFADVGLASTSNSGVMSSTDWQQQAAHDAGKPLTEANWQTPEGLTVKPL